MDVDSSGKIDFAEFIEFIHLIGVTHRNEKQKPSSNLDNDVEGKTDLQEGDFDIAKMLLSESNDVSAGVSPKGSAKPAQVDNTIEDVGISQKAIDMKLSIKPSLKPSPSINGFISSKIIVENTEDAVNAIEGADGIFDEAEIVEKTKDSDMNIVSSNLTGEEYPKSKIITLAPIISSSGDGHVHS